MVAEQDHGFLGGLRTDGVLHLHLPDPVDIPAVVPVKGHVVLPPARRHARVAVRRAPGEINDHPPLPARGRVIAPRPALAGSGEETERVGPGDRGHRRASRCLQKIPSVHAAPPFRQG